MVEKFSFFVFSLQIAIVTAVQACGVGSLSPGDNANNHASRTAPDGDAYPGTPAEFVQWCFDKNPDIALTVDAIRTSVGASSCQEVGTAYESRGSRSLVLFAPGITNLLPLLAFPDLKILGIQHSNVSDFSPLTLLASLDTVVVSADGLAVDLSSLAASTSITSVTVENFQQLDIAPLSKMALTSLHVKKGLPLQLGLLADLTKLRILTLNETNLTDLTFLSVLGGLTTLDIGGNGAISDFSPLAALASLTTLRAADTNLSDLKVIAGTTGLSMLDISASPSLGSTAVDLSPLAGLTKLNALHANNRKLQNISALSGLPLRYLYMQASGVETVASLTSLSTLQYLDLSKNTLKGNVDLSPLKQVRILNLSSCGLSQLPMLPVGDALIELYLNDNSIIDISSLAGREGLSKLFAAGNLISSLTPISGLSMLTEADFSGNAIKSVETVKDLPEMRQLILKDNPIPFGSLCPLDDQAFCTF